MASFLRGSVQAGRDLDVDPQILCTVLAAITSSGPTGFRHDASANRGEFYWALNQTSPSLAISRNDMFLSFTLIKQ